MLTCGHCLQRATRGRDRRRVIAHAIAMFAMLQIVPCLTAIDAFAQVAPSANEIARYEGLHKAAHDGDVAKLRALAAAGAEVNATDDNGRTPLHVAAFAAQHGAMQALVDAGADPNALDHDRYDIVTIAAVANDVATLKQALALGTRPGNTTSRYDGTALIAAAHLGHENVVRTLIAAGAALDHVNNLGWTALIEAIVLGDGGPAHVATLNALVDAGADVSLADRNGRTPLALARERGFENMVERLERAGAK